MAPTRTAAPAPAPRLALGIDVGGTGVKAALVDLATAELASPRIRERTPVPATPEAVTETIARVVARIAEGQTLPADLPVGCGLPGVVKDGRLLTAANIDAGWVGWPAEERIGAALGRRVRIFNDADAAGLAELAYGEAAGRPGTVILLTIGTGIGSAVFLDGKLVPNTEYGHLEFHGRDAETLVSGAARERRKLGWKRWARDFGAYLAGIEATMWPDLFIFGGGVSKEWAKWGRHLRARTPIVLARFLNTSGIIGAAWAAADAASRPDRPASLPVSAAPAAAPTAAPGKAAAKPAAKAAAKPAAKAAAMKKAGAAKAAAKPAAKPARGRA